MSPPFTIGELLTALLSVLSPLVAVPVAVMMFQMRSLRADQQSKHQEMNRWSEWMQREMDEVRRFMKSAPREYAGKEEWLRESMRMRQAVERLSENLARQESRLEGFGGAGGLAEARSRRSFAFSGPFSGVVVMNGSRSTRRIKQVRNEILVVLKLLYPNALQAEQILRTLLGLFPDLEWEHLKRDLAYLGEKGYLQRVVTDREENGGEMTPWKSRWFRLTTKGMEVADHCIQDPALE